MIYNIIIEWDDGTRQKIDSAESESEAIYLVKMYLVKYTKAKRIWMQH